MKDNRNYRYKLNENSFRAEYGIISGWIPANSNVLDLGCGDGSLLKLLGGKGIKGEGIDISPTGIKSARKKGIRATVGRIDTKLKYKKGYFDFAICNVTLQMVLYPEILLDEMARVSKQQIISFPNFAFINNRIELFLDGRMPMRMFADQKWYSTGLIHQLSLSDFEKFCQVRKLKIVNRYFFTIQKFGPIPEIILKMFPKLFTVTAIYMLSGKK